MFRGILLSLLLGAGLLSPAQQKLVYRFDILEEIGPAVWRQTDEAFAQAEKKKADYILIHMNTYGGAVDAADKIYSRILNCPIPVMVFIDDNAASAGSLIALACDSIYMRSSAKFGAAVVVDQSGTPAPEKYQSYWRSAMRAAAQKNGRNPALAEGMNDARTRIEGVKDSGIVLTLTATEAVKNKYCEGIAESITEVLNKAGIKNYKVESYEVTTIGKVIDFFANPVVSGILIMIIVAGFYFEFQHPGALFPIGAAVGAAILYFAPHYLQGLADNWEILMFIAGLILLALEIFVIPGFGVTGILGIIFTVLGLTLSLIGHLPSDSPVPLPDFGDFVKALFLVVMMILVSTIVSFYLGGRLVKSTAFARVALTKEIGSEEGYSSADVNLRSLIGKTGRAFTVLRPSGKIEIEGSVYDATAEMGFIEKGEPIVVTNYITAQLFVRKA